MPPAPGIFAAHQYTRKRSYRKRGDSVHLCDLEGHELLNLVDVPNKRGRLYRRHEAWQNVIAWFLRRSGIGIMGSAYGTPPTCKGIFSMAAAQATGWHAMGESAADDFRKENYLIAGIIVYLDNLAAGGPLEDQAADAP